MVAKLSNADNTKVPPRAPHTARTTGPSANSSVTSSQPQASGDLRAPSVNGIGTVLAVYVRHTRTGQLTLVNSTTVDHDFE